MLTATHGSIDSGGKRIIIWFNIEHQDHFFVYDGELTVFHSLKATMTYKSTSDLKGSHEFVGTISGKHIKIDIHNNGPEITGTLDESNQGSMFFSGTGKWLVGKNELESELARLEEA